MIVFACPQCAKPYRLNPEFAGRTTQCSGCKAPLVVPHAAATPAPDRIAFNCGACGMKFRVPPECAGRATACPTCKQPLVVPQPEQTLAATPAIGQIHGAPSSLARAGIDASVSLTADTGNAAPAWQHLLDGKGSDGARYVVESEIARGGMGVVMRAVDCDIRREVAVKYLLDQADAGKKLRFVEEAQITGQLEHPNIVPIHELGVDAQKRIFFAMKMVKGRSLAQILTTLREEPKSAEKAYPLGKLLNIFVNICNALAYAHSRGVVHRDLKPANIMVGDFGEVYVMDWGLAKVLKRGTAAPVQALPVARFANADADADAGMPSVALPVAAPVATSTTSGSGQVVTSREGDADLTQDGAVLGTPVYMPPEQAAGKLPDIDERSDVYSMGAILYELLTLQPPISKEGGYWPILLRVTQGQITPPEQKDPQRTRAGKVPSELAAVAMKALAKRKEDRYPGVDLLRQDVERFMEGRSVSAKHDTVREAVVKLIKRNQGVSIATAAAAVVLAVVALWSLSAILRANARTRQEEQAKQEQAKQAVPLFVRAAKLAVAERQFDDALVQINAVLNIEPDQADARLLRAMLLLTQQDYAGARIDLESHQRLRPDHAQTKVLLAFTQKARVDDKATLLALADALNGLGSYVFVDRVLKGADKLMVVRQELLARYRQRLEKSWPGVSPRLTLNAAGEFELDLSRMDINDLEPLRGLPLVRLTVYLSPKVVDLTPLQDMRLTFLRLSRTEVKDLTPLAGMPLVELDLSVTKVVDLRPLAGMPLTALHLYACSQVRDLTPLRGMPLTTLELSGCDQVSDLTPLKGMPLTNLDLTGCSQVGDLTPLKGMRIPVLNLGGFAKIRDLTPLKGMPLTKLNLSDCKQITDVSPLKDTPLIAVILPSHVTKGVEELRGVKTLTTINGTPAAQFWQQWDAARAKERAP